MQESRGKYYGLLFPPGKQFGLNATNPMTASRQKPILENESTEIHE